MRSARFVALLAQRLGGGMLVLANGAFKSGSTWLRDIVREMLPFSPIPEAFQHPDYSHWIGFRKLPEFLRHADYHAQHYLSKSHIYDPRLRDLLLARDDVRVLNIRRDVRDVLVSHYFHMRRMKKVGEGFPAYYWRLGRLKACQILEYHSCWSTPAPNVYTTSFERLKASFAEEVRAVGDFLGVALSADAIGRIEEETGLCRLQMNAGEADKPEAERFFRKGVVGDWRNHFDRDMLADLERIQAHGLSLADSIKYKIVFDLRLRFKHFLVGRSRLAAPLLARL